MTHVNFTETKYNLSFLFQHFQLTATLKGRMMNNGTLMIGYQPIDLPSMKIPNFFRSIISNAGVQEKDIDYMLDELDRLGHDL